jgi:hypothetical protein
VVQAFIQPYNPDNQNFNPKQYDVARTNLLSPSIADELNTLVNLVTFTDSKGNVVPTLVDTLVTPFTVTVQSSVPSSTGTKLSTTVCAQIRPFGSIEAPRRIIFVLEHVPPGQEVQNGTTVATTDQMQLINGADVTTVAEDGETSMQMPVVIGGPPQ